MRFATKIGTSWSKLKLLGISNIRESRFYVKTKQKDKGKEEI
jgi:hypothetical protein